MINNATLFILWWVVGIGATVSLFGSWASPEKRVTMLQSLGVVSIVAAALWAIRIMSLLQEMANR